MKDETGEFLLLGRGISRIDGQNYTRTERSAIRDVTLHAPRPIHAIEDVSATVESDFEGLTCGEIDRLMVAVRDLLVIEGLESVSPLTAAQRAGLRGKQVLLVARHFPSRAELVIALNERFFSPLFEALSEGVLGQATVMGRIKRIGSQWFSVAGRDVPLALAFADLNERGDLRAEDAPLQRLLMRQRDLRHSVFTGLLAEGQMRGEIRQGNLDVMMMTIVGCYMGMLRTLSQPSRLLDSGIYAQDILEETQRTIIAALRPDPVEG